eukprot:CAMPEP_0115280350 /NCGR_PEP_ID=MMETSP0270-20121206/58744_1 /TAXON_ID=71861 /ORGANISM="Scrippsiella trochoidea, Strain CCMP3099" /LENGTH=53 /DNA_ID=CAMNT_0002697087 /DNA_START=42 /DNA_END=203 /DNA_ORIENTATION=-
MARNWRIGWELQLVAHGWGELPDIQDAVAVEVQLSEPLSLPSGLFLSHLPSAP